MRREWDGYSLAERSVFVNLTRELLELSAEYCRMPIADTAQMINGFGQLLDDSGYTTRNDIRVRNALMLVLV